MSTSENSQGQISKEEQSCVLIHQVCATCKTELNADEIEYYGHTCNECEGRTIYEEGPERERLDTVTELRKKVVALETRCKELESDKVRLIMNKALLREAVKIIHCHNRNLHKDFLQRARATL